MHAFVSACLGNLKGNKQAQKKKNLRKTLLPLLLTLYAFFFFPALKPLAPFSALCQSNVCIQRACHDVPTPSAPLKLVCTVPVYGTWQIHEVLPSYYRVIRLLTGMWIRFFWLQAAAQSLSSSLISLNRNPPQRKPGFVPENVQGSYKPKQDGRA